MELTRDPIQVVAAWADWVVMKAIVAITVYFVFLLCLGLGTLLARVRPASVGPDCDEDL